jgi:ABC-type uncharacterized transport system substrate-binding protein
MISGMLAAYAIFAFSLFALCSPAVAQQSTGTRMGYLSVLSPSSDHSRNEAFRRGLRELGYMDGQNIRIEARYAEGDLKRLPKLASKLASLKPDVVVAGGSTAIGAMKKATSTIPIVMAHGSDPVELGYVESLAKPGGNITGLTHLAPELGGKRLEFLKAIVPKLSRVAVLTDPGASGHRPQMKELETAGPAARVTASRIRGPGFDPVRERIPGDQNLGCRSFGRAPAPDLGPPASVDRRFGGQESHSRDVPQYRIC